jgi:hypothetical protein
MKRTFLLVLVTLVSLSFLWSQTIVDIAQNGDFENWTGGNPDNWYGARSSIGTSNVVEYTDAAYSGTSSCQLIRTSSSHARFTTEAFSILADTEYTVTYYARGQGNIRNAFYRGGSYSSYSSYTPLNSDDWTQIVWTFQYSSPASDVEVIFSVQSTNAARDHIQIDAVTITYESPDSAQLFTSVNELTGFAYVVDAGPSDPQSFELSGSELDGSNVTVTAPTNFQVSESENSGYGGSVTLSAYDGSNTDIWVRLASGLALGAYSGNVSIAGGDAETIQVAVSGDVVGAFGIPYSNDFRAETDVDLAKAQGFEFSNYQVHETSDPYFRFITVGSYLESPTIDFTEYDYLELVFYTNNYGSGSGRELSVMLSDDDGTSYGTAEVVSVDSGSFVIQEVIVDLTDTYDVVNGKFKLEMTGGTGSIRFRDFSVDEYEVLVPTILVNPETLSGFTYEVGAGPSAEQQFSISGLNLTDDITITAPTNYEISETTGAGFTNQIILQQSGGSVAETTIFVILKDELSAGTYNNEIISATSDGAVTKEVTCNGSVTEPVTYPSGVIFFDNDFGTEENWTDLEPTGWTGYNPKAYSDGNWYFHSTASVRGTLAYELYGTSSYAFRDRGTFTIYNTAPINGMTGFTLQLFDWMLNDGTDRALNVSFNGGTDWETVLTINKAWFDEYQVYQEFVYVFPALRDARDFAAEDFQIQILGGDGTNDSRINIGYFEAYGDEQEDPPLPVELSSFTASIFANQFVQLVWVSETETNLSGYNVFRSTMNELADAVLINPEMIKATNTSSQQSYEFIDEDVFSGETYFYWLQSLDLDLTSNFHGPVSILVSHEEEGDTPPVVLRTELVGAFPNPFNPDTRIAFTVAEEAEVKISVYNALGQLMQVVAEGVYSKGQHLEVWNGKDQHGRTAASGIYFYKMETDTGFEMIKKMALIK